MLKVRTQKSILPLLPTPLYERGYSNYEESNIDPLDRRRAVSCFLRAAIHTRKRGGGGVRRSDRRRSIFYRPSEEERRARSEAGSRAARGGYQRGQLRASEGGGRQARALFARRL